MWLTGDNRRSSRIVVPALSIFVVVSLALILVFLVTVDPDSRVRAKANNLTYYPEPVAKPGYVLTKEQLGGSKIAAYLLRSEAPGERKRPAVILIHGGGIVDPLRSSKPQYKGEWFIPLYEEIPYRMAKAGILVVAIDAWWAGERHRPEHDELAQANPVAAIFRGYVETSHDVSEVIDCLVARGDVDPKRIGVGGKSGGGIISLMAACNDERIQAVVAWKAGPDFLEMERLRGETILMNQALNSDRNLPQEIQQWDPIYHYQKIPPKALALIGNYEDPNMPRQGAQKLYDKLRPLYEAYSERLMIRFFQTPEPTHTLGPEAFALGCEWFERFLARPSSLP